MGPAPQLSLFVAFVAGYTMCLLTIGLNVGMSGSDGKTGAASSSAVSVLVERRLAVIEEWIEGHKQQLGSRPADTPKSVSSLRASKHDKSPTAKPLLDDLWHGLQSVPGFLSPLAHPPPVTVCPLEQPDFTVAQNPRGLYNIVTYGETDFISAVCLGKKGSHGVFFEEHLTNFMVALLQHHSSGSKNANTVAFFQEPWMVDFGSNIGVHTIGVAAEGFGVIAIEANSYTAARVRCSVAVNGLTNVGVVNAGIGGTEQDGTTMCSTTTIKSPNAGGALVVPGTCDHDKKLVVNLMTIDSLFARLPESLPAPLIMKIDIEGWEGVALAGATRFFEQRAPEYVFMEINPYYQKSHNSSARAIFEYLSSRRYHAWLSKGGTDVPIELTSADWSDEKRLYTLLDNHIYDVMFSKASRFPVPLPEKIHTNYAV